jgi:tetratricopeptide (TPR) repeat protein
MKRVSWWAVGLVVGLGVALASPRAALAQSCPESAATVVSVQGTVESQRAGATQWEPVRLNDTYCPGDTIRAQARSRANIALVNQSVLRLRENTTLTIEGLKDERTYLVDLLQGAAHFLSRRGPRDLEVNTPYTVAGVRGTEFFIEVGANQALLTVFEGSVLASNASGSLMLADGQSAVAEAGKAPVLRVVAQPRDAVRWALYYLPVVYVQPDEFPDGPGWQGRVRESTDAYRRGDLQQAFASIEGVADQDVQDARFFSYRASLLLAVGSVDEAGADIERALGLAPNDSDALALQTIIAVVQNRKDEALEIARRAVEADARSATARIALSYAQQARFDLEGARSSLEEAVALDPDDALAWARLAELHSSFGDLDDSLEAAQKAVSLEPNLARTQTVLGFAHLTKVETKDAAAAFDKAIALDQADPLPRLGLGLARIREGDLKQGGRDIEVAASLDSGNSLVRSYLGKTYFEEKRTELDEREYKVAKELDPNDPTPWFYDAIAKQTTNRPVEALRANQRAIELNDNRAVYRSRLLLDSDLAARSAAVARIYGDLGFQNLALVEGWKSLGTDPTNFSAHRLLSDSYSALPRHEIARVSELLQSQLLQPINITPIQPRLGESNLFLVSAQGPTGLSFNEFNPLFNRNRVALQANGLFGEDETYSGEGIVSAIYDRASVSGGYTYYDTDGFRTNNDLTDKIGTAFAQYELSHQTSLQAEYRYRRRDNGDLELRFFEDDFSPFLTEKIEGHTARGGLRHAFSPRSILLASYIYQDKDTDSDDFAPGNPTGFFNDPTLTADVSSERKTEERANSIEAQYLYRSESLDWTGVRPGWIQGLVRNVNLVAGMGYFDIDGEVSESIVTGDLTLIFRPIIDLDPIVIPGSTTTVSSSPDVRHWNYYLYSYLYLPAGFTLTAGVSGDSLSSDAVDKSLAHPKVGLQWTPSFLPGMTIRGAAFRTLKRTLVTDQTLEPTQVAGFNQFFDDVNGTEAWRYGGAIDQKFTESIFGGIEYSERDLEVPGGFVAAGGGADVLEADWDEQLARAYLFWTPHEWVSFRAEYQWEKFERDPFTGLFGNEIFFAFKEVETHRVPFGVQFFHPCGISAMMGATWVDQEGEFFRDDFPPGTQLQEGDRSFWVLDTALRYRLPKRYGFVTFGVNNFLDEDSTYQATDVRNPSIRPGRFIFGSVTLAFP